MTAAKRILPLLQGVRQRGDCRWIGRCPTHDDGTPSLSIRQVDGGILIYCWAGCETAAVLAAIGLGLDDLYDDQSSRFRKPASDRRRRAVRGLLVWRDSALMRTGNALRERDGLIRTINTAVADGVLTGAAALASLAALYRDYSWLEYRFEILRTGTTDDALELWRQSRGNGHAV